MESVESEAQVSNGTNKEITSIDNSNESCVLYMSNHEWRIKIEF